MLGDRKQVEVGVCGICGESIRVEPPPIPEEAALLSAAREAAEEHVATHSTTQIVHAQLRRVLPQLPSSEREEAVKQVYAELRKMWGDQDSRGVYSIDEVLGSSAMYRLWHDAGSCGRSDRGCAHRS